MKIRGYTRNDGVKVRSHSRKNKNTRKYSKAEQKAFNNSKVSKSGHKSYKERLKEKNPGIWSHVWAKRRKIKRS